MPAACRPFLGTPKRARPGPAEQPRLAPAVPVPSRQLSLPDDDGEPANPETDAHHDYMYWEEIDEMRNRASLRNETFPEVEDT